MNERFRLNFAHIVVLSILLRSIASHCRPEIVQDTVSNPEAANYAPEDLHKVDPSIAQIFRGPIEKPNNPDTDLQSPQQTNSHLRQKRENTLKKNNQKSVNEATKSEQKRSVKSNKASSSSRSMRSSRDSSRISDKRSSDYDVPVDQEASEYVDEAEEEPSTGSKDKESGYKARQFHVAEDSDRFTDQEERSSLYDDFETKDIAKRGISGSEDYEELDEESIEPEEDTALDEEESLVDESDKKKVHGDARVKREHDGVKEPEASQTSAKLDDSSSDPKLLETFLNKDNSPVLSEKVSDSKLDSSDPEYSKRNVADKQATESKTNPELSKQTSATSDAKNTENSKILNQETQEASLDRKIQDTGLSSDKAADRLVGESSGLKESSKVDESKIIDLSSPETGKVDAVAETAASKDVGKVDSSMNEDGDYEKRVEEQIQRKIDSIKEEIKREIAQKQRIREIEENNAKFDELHELEEEDEEQDSESEPSEKQENVAKRSTSNSGKVKETDSADERDTKRKKRQNDGQGRLKTEESESGKKSVRETGKKRNSRSELTPILRETQVRKRDNPREIIVVRSERNAAKKKRRRRSKGSAITDERSVQVKENLPADVMVDSGLREDAGDGKMNKDERAIAEQDSVSIKKSGSVASLTGNDEEMGPLATEYGDAFGGLNNDPGVSLARFKRIKRVLRPSSSKT